MKISEQLQHTIDTGEPMTTTIPGVISFTIHRRNIPAPMTERPPDFPTLKKSGLEKYAWLLAKQLHARELNQYNMLRQAWVEERYIIARLQRILKMVKSYGL